jgi:hypothetical protein
LKNEPRTPSGEDITAQWDGMDFMKRLKLIMDHADLFHKQGLVANSEIDAVNAMHESDREYIVEREDQPIFTSLHLKETVAAQQHRDKLEAALKAVFM